MLVILLIRIKIVRSLINGVDANHLVILHIINSNLSISCIHNALTTGWAVAFLRPYDLGVP